MDNSLTIERLLMDLRASVAANAFPAAAAVVGLTALSVVVDVSGWSGLNLAWSIASLVTQVAVTSFALSRAGFPATGRARIWALLGIGFLTGLGILVGVALLILPGFYLAGRWSAATSFILRSDAPVTAAIGQSWNGTRDAGWPLCAALALIWVPSLALGFVVMMLFGNTVPLVASGVFALLGQIASTVSWLLGVVVYVRIESGLPSLSEVFA